ncbi:hypothetical protein CCACVL1_16959 [Corchorus capsularis]|uniref:Uncharacterized protein n=1 Tax=Corchorus capsularis TaxID=210143 RepID=A0A1R3HV17_COCAP|nr:hypothetical protein CCACVL1_16959 [Corchorus capsularis]
MTTVLTSKDSSVTNELSISSICSFQRASMAAASFFTSEWQSQRRAVPATLQFTYSSPLLL